MNPRHSLALLMLSAFAPGLAHAAPPAQAERPLPADSRFSVTVEGSGPDVILIPGLSSPRAVWDGTRAALAGRYRLHLVQIRGFGGDAPGPNLEGAVIEGLVAQLADYIRAHNLRSPAVIGHSMGGLTGLMLARRHPTLLGKLMIVDSLPYIGVIWSPAATVPLVEPQARVMRDRMAAAYGRPVDEAAMRGIAEFNALKPEARALVMRWSAAADARVTARVFYETATTDMRPELASVTTPITLVYPWSEAVPKDRADALYRGQYTAAPRVTFVDVGDARHFVMLDQPERFHAAVRTFLGG